MPQSFHTIPWADEEGLVVIKTLAPSPIPNPATRRMYENTPVLAFVLLGLIIGCGGGGSSTPSPILPAVSAPSNLVYPQTTITAIVGQAINIDTPTATGTVSSYSVRPALPTGLNLNISTGAISGTPTAAVAQASYVVTAANSAGSTSASLQITVNDTSTTAPGIYIFNNATATSLEIYQFSKTDSGSITPNKILRGPDNMVATALAIDKTGRLYIAGQEINGTAQTGLKVLVFSAGAQGTSTPDQTIELSYTGNTSAVEAMAVDDAQNLYVYMDTHIDAPGASGGQVALYEGIIVYAPGANGIYAPSREITGDATSISRIRQIAVDSADNIYAANQGTSSILIFNSSARGNIPPTATLTSTSEFASISGVAADSAGNIYVAATPLQSIVLSSNPVLPLTYNPELHPTIFVFRPGSSGVVAPTRIIVSTGLPVNTIGNLAVDDSGNMYLLVELFTDETLSQDPEIFKYAVDANGYVDPAARIQSNLINVPNGGIAVY
jgi:hypothetical protein